MTAIARTARHLSWKRRAAAGRIAAVIASPPRRAGNRTGLLAGTFIAGVGATAAVVGHQCAHVIGDSGAFTTPFDEYAHVGLEPLALLAGVLALLALGIALAHRDVRDALATRPRDVAREIAAHGLVRALIAILAVEFVSLYGMEIGEQTLAFGHPLAGFAWLGGPVLSMLPLYLGIGVASAMLLIGLARILAVACRAATALLGSYARRLRPRLAGSRVRRRAYFALRVISAIARPGAKRGPPELS